MNQNNTPTIEAAIAELEAAVAWFEGDEFVLEEALEKYQVASESADDIIERIEALKQTIVEVEV